MRSGATLRILRLVLYLTLPIHAGSAGSYLTCCLPHHGSCGCGYRLRLHIFARLPVYGSPLTTRHTRCLPLHRTVPRSVRVLRLVVGYRGYAHGYVVHVCGYLTLLLRLRGYAVYCRTTPARLDCHISLRAGLLFTAATLLPTVVCGSACRLVTLTALHTAGYRTTVGSYGLRYLRLPLHVTTFPHATHGCYAAGWFIWLPRCLLRTPPPPRSAGSAGLPRYTFTLHTG